MKPTGSGLHWPKRVTPETITPEQIVAHYTHGEWPSHMVQCDFIKIIGDLAIKQLQVSEPGGTANRASARWNRRDFTQIPPHMMARLQAYIERHEPVGDFLTAVLKNDLHDACSRGDDTNVEIIPVYMAYLYNEAPGPCWGSPEKVKAWLERVPA